MKDKGNDKMHKNKTTNKIIPTYDIMADVTEIVNPDGSSTFRFGKGIPDWTEFDVFYQLHYGYDAYLKLVAKTNKYSKTNLKSVANPEARTKYSRYLD